MRPRDILLALLPVCAWGFNFVVIEVGVGEIPPILFVALRYALAAYPAVFFVPRPALPWWKLIGLATILGVLQFSFMFTGMHIGVSAGLASIVAQVQAVFTVAIAFVLFGERPTRLQALGIAIAVAGIALIGLQTGGRLTLPGLTLVLIGAFFWGASNVWLRHIGPVNMLHLMVWVGIVPPLPLFAVSWLIEGPEAFRNAIVHMTWLGFGAVAYNAFVAALIAYAAWARLLRQYGGAMIAPFSLLAPVVGMSSAALLLGETFTPGRLLAALLILAGITLNVFGGTLARLLTRWRTLNA
ncbi:MAG: EamA family transporter [Candidatus Lambdaproteobacteria bacterium]|nr:EamA family transporter [Candidatus Lambdaproteobacteria bacterium]